jgi:methionyl-tRNA formyltransferase
VKVLLFSAGTIGLPSIEALQKSSHEILGVVTTPAKPMGRGRRVQESPVKASAEKSGLKVYSHARVNAPESLAIYRELKADVFAIVSFGQILSEEFIGLTRFGCVNLHPSLLPKYRGASPIAHSLLQGEKRVGVSIMKIVKELDAGDVYLQEGVDLKGHENESEVTRLLAGIGAELLVKTLDRFEKGDTSSQPQDTSKVIYAPKLRKDDGKLDWLLPAERLHNQVRAFYEWPGSFTNFGSTHLIILKTERSSEDSTMVPGAVMQIDSKKGILVKAGKGSLWIKELKPQGKRAMGFRDFLNGHPLKAGDVFGGSS